MDSRRRPGAASAGDRGGAADAETFADPGEGELIAAGKDREFARQAGGDLWEEYADEAATLGRELDFDEAAVGGIAGARDEAVALEVVDDESEVAAALEQFGGELGLEERPEVVEGFEGGELCEGDAVGQDEVGAGGDGVGGSHQLDVGVEGENLAFRSLVMGAHFKKTQGCCFEVNSSRDAGECDLGGVDFIDAGDVAPAFEGRCEPDFHDVQSFGLGDGALAKGKDVGVVVRAVPNGDLFVPAETAADAFDAVGDDGFAVAGAAKDDAALILAAGDGLGHGPDEIGVVAARLGIGAEVAHGVAGVEEHGLDGFLVGKAGVIGTDGDGKGVGHGEAEARGLG